MADFATFGFYFHSYIQNCLTFSFGDKNKKRITKNKKNYIQVLKISSELNSIIRYENAEVAEMK